MSKAHRGKKIAIILVLVFFIVFLVISGIVSFISPETNKTTEESLNQTGTIEITGNVENNNDLYDSTGLVVTGFEA